MRSFVIATCLAGIASGANAASLNKCVDAQGHVTFTQQACPDGGAGERLNVTSQSAGMLVAQPPAPPVETEQRDASTPNTQPSVIGGENSSGCGSASDQEIRTAIVQNKVFTGMSAKEAIQSWGKPTSINRSSRGDDQWVYDRGRASSQYLYVNQEGCVTAWN